MKFPAPRAQRIVQAISAVCYLLLLLSVLNIGTVFYPDFYLRIDPIIAAGTSIATRSIPPRLIIGLALILLPFFLGRVFCGWICPMGIAIDTVDWITKKHFKGNRINGFDNPGTKKWRWVKYAFLLFCTGSAIVGINLYFYLAPISLINRFFVSVLYPITSLITNTLLELIRPLASLLNIQSLYYLSVKQHVFATNFFVAFFVSGIFTLALISPRFWCRYLCPSGAVLALFSSAPVIRRTVYHEKCTRCGICQKRCPMKAIAEDPATTLHEECLSCLKCSKICPEHAIRFAFTPSKPRITPIFKQERRNFFGWGVGGILSGLLFYTNPSRGTSKDVNGKGGLSHPVRPPGSIPEGDFLKKCARCYECIFACPTNTLQPIWFEAGLEAIWTPKVTSSFAPCDKDCAACGQACPTGAIRPLSLADKIYCKIGTARIYKNRCLAWEHDRKCLVCDEVCPYDAVTFIAVGNRKNRVPRVDARKCSGCGYCESHCPVNGKKAIVVEVFGEVRLAHGSYRQAAKSRKLELKLGGTSKEGKLPPGFDFSN